MKRYKLTEKGKDILTFVLVPIIALVCFVITVVLGIAIWLYII